MVRNVPQLKHTVPRKGRDAPHELRDLNDRRPDNVLFGVGLTVRDRVHSERFVFKKVQSREGEVTGRPFEVLGARQSVH